MSFVSRVHHLRNSLWIEWRIALRFLADEPTGNLDTQTADEVFTLFERFNVEHQCAIIIVTHDPRLSARCPRTIRLTDGKVVYDGASNRSDSR